jgi:hypothetical protein
MKSDVLINNRKYHVQGCSLNNRPKINAVTFSNNETIRHVLGKTLAAYLIHKYGDIKIEEEVMLLIRRIDSLVEEDLMKDFVRDPHEFITEAVPNDNPKRRIDIVDLNTDTHIEIETDHSIKKEGAITIKI